MKLSELTPQSKAKALGTIAHAVQQTIGDDNLFLMLIVDDTGHMADVKNINRSAIPRLLREYADQVERKNAGERINGN